MSLAMMMDGFNLNDLVRAILFAHGEQGFLYDPSDFRTLFQDAAGTTPVTALGQSVGLVLDKSKGLVLGVEKFSDGNITFTAPSALISTGVYRVYSSDGSFSNVALSGLTIGKFYEASFTIDSVSVVGSGIVVDWPLSPQFTTPGVKRVRLYATSNTFSIKRVATACDYQISNISVRELPGNHATQSTALSRPTLQQDSTGRYYLSFDGTDDGMVTNSIDFTGTNKMTLWAGVRKNSDAASTIVAELSAAASVNAGAFNLQAPRSGASYGIGVRGTSVNAGDYSTFTAPVSNVISASLTTVGSNIAETINARFNGVANSGVANSNSVSTGNFGSYPLYIGRRGGTSLPFNGRIYQLIGRGAETPLAQIQAIEQYVNAKTRAY